MNKRIGTHLFNVGLHRILNWPDIRRPDIRPIQYPVQPYSKQELFNIHIEKIYIFEPNLPFLKKKQLNQTSFCRLAIKKTFLHSPFFWKIHNQLSGRIRIQRIKDPDPTILDGKHHRIRILGQYLPNIQCPLRRLKNYITQEKFSKIIIVWRLEEVEPSHVSQVG